MKRWRAVCIVSLFLLTVSASAIVASADTQDYFPAAQTLTKGTSSGTFPDNVQSSNNAYVTPLEANQAAADSSLDPDTQTLTKGTNCGGTFPSSLTTSDNAYLCHREADQAAISDLLADTETITTGTKVSGDSPPTPSDVDTDNGVTITYREANVGGAISFVGSAENSAANGADVTLTLPAMQENDIVIVSYTIGDNDGVNFDMAMVTTGYTEVADVFADDTQDLNLGVYWKVMGPTPDASAVVDGQGGADAAVAAVALVFRGVDTTTPMDVTPTTASNINTMHPDPPSIDYVSSGVWTVIAGASGHTLLGAGTYTFPTGYTTNAIDRGQDDTSDATVGMGYRTNPADPEDPGVMTHSGTDSANFAWGAATIALRPGPNYQLAVQYDWTTETCADTRRLTINSWHTSGEDSLVQVWDFTLSAWNTRITVTATSDGTTQTWDLSAASPNEWNSGAPRVRFIGNTESGDASQNDYIADLVVVRCVPPADFEMEYRVDWTGETCAGTRTVRVEAFHTDTEDVLLQVVDAAESVWTTRITITATVDPDTYQTYTLTEDEWDLGAPNVRFLGNAESGDGTQTDVSIDDLEVRCTPTASYEVEIRYDWTGVDTTGDSWELKVECKRVLSPENGLLQVLTPPATWNTAYTCSTDADVLYTGYLLNGAELNAGAPATRIIDASGGDTGQSSWDLDLIVITRTFTPEDPPEDPPDGGDDQGSGFHGGLLRVSCAYAFFMLSCDDVTDYLSYRNMVRLDWYVNGEYRGSTEIHGRIVAGGVGDLSNGSTVLLTVAIYFRNGGTAQHSWLFTFDNTPNFVLLIGVIALSSAIALHVYFRRWGER